MPVKCDKCGAQIADGSQTCSACGAVLMRHEQKRKATAKGIIGFVVGIVIAISVIAYARTQFTAAPEKPKVIIPPDIAKSIESSPTPDACVGGSTITREPYRVVGTDVVLSTGPGTNYEKAVDTRATMISKQTKYLTIDSQATVLEECTNGDCSYVQVLRPAIQRHTHKGWVPSQNLDKG